MFFVSAGTTRKRDAQKYHDKLQAERWEPDTYGIATDHHIVCGSVQQGLSAAGGALGYYRLRGAADKRYSLKPASSNATILSMKVETIRREALSLTSRERAELAEQLWLHEAARRADEIDRGLTNRISADDVRREAQALLR